MNKLLAGFTGLMMSMSVHATPIMDTGDELWTFNDIAGTVTNSILIELTALALPNTAKFGIYDGNNPASKAEIFDGGNLVSEYARIEWDADTHVMELFKSVNGLTWTSIGNSIVPEVLFGFYLEEGGTTLYSQNSLNGGLGYDPLAVTQATADSYGLLWDTDGNGDYNNFIAIADDIIPVRVPEPAPLALMGLGLLGMTRLRRK